MDAFYKWLTKKLLPLLMPMQIDQPLPKSLRTYSQGFNGEEHEEVYEGQWAVWCCCADWWHAKIRQDKIDQYAPSSVTLSPVLFSPVQPVLLLIWYDIILRRVTFNSTTLTVADWLHFMQACPVWLVAYRYYGDPNHERINLWYSCTRQDIAKDPTTARPPEFVPVTYLLPADYNLFVEEFRR